MRLKFGVFRVFGGYRYQLLLRIAIFHLNEVAHEPPPAASVQSDQEKTLMSFVSHKDARHHD